MEIKFETDLDILNAARNRVAYGGQTNSLVEWTMSPAWTTPTRGGISQTSVAGEFSSKPSSPASENFVLSRADF